MRSKRFGGRQRNRRVRRQRSSEDFLELLELIRFGNQQIGDDDEFTRDLYGVSRNSTSHISIHSLQRRNVAHLTEAPQDADRIVGTNHNRARRGGGGLNYRRNSAGYRQLRSQRERRHEASLPLSRRRNVISPTVDHVSSFTSLQNCNQRNKTIKNMTKSERELYCDLLILEELEKDDVVKSPIVLEAENVNSSSTVVMSNQLSLISMQEQSTSQDSGFQRNSTNSNVSAEFNTSNEIEIVDENQLFSEMAAGLILSIESENHEQNANQNAQQSNDNSAGGDGVHNDPNFRIQFTFSDGDLFIAEEINPQVDAENNSHDNNAAVNNQNDNENNNNN